MGDYHIQRSVLPGSDPTTTPYNPHGANPSNTAVQPFAPMQQAPQQQGSKTVFVQPAGAPQQQQIYGAPQQGGAYGQQPPPGNYYPQGQMQQQPPPGNYYQQQPPPGSYMQQPPPGSYMQQPPPGSYMQQPVQGIPQQPPMVVMTTTTMPTMVMASPWMTSMCGCCSENEGGGCCHFCEAYFCTCWMFGKNREIVMGTDRCCACILYAITWPLLALLIILAAALVVFTLGCALFCIPACVPCCIACGGVYPASNRNSMRERLGLKGSMFEDFMLHCCCAVCAVSQEARELRRRGFVTPGSVPDPTRVMMNPPQQQVMMVASPQHPGGKHV